MVALQEDRHSQAQREAARNRRADAIMGWFVLALLVGVAAGTLAGWL